MENTETPGMEKAAPTTSEIFKLFNGMTPEELKQSDNKFLMSWDILTPAINETVLLRKYEVIKGYIVSEKGIEIVVGFKDGRKRHSA